MKIFTNILFFILGIIATLFISISALLGFNYKDFKNLKYINVTNVEEIKCSKVLDTNVPIRYTFDLYSGQNGNDLLNYRELHLDSDGGLHMSYGEFSTIYNAINNKLFTLDKSSLKECYRYNLECKENNLNDSTFVETGRSFLNYSYDLKTSIDYLYVDVEYLSDNDPLFVMVDIGIEEVDTHLNINIKFTLTVTGG